MSNDPLTEARFWAQVTADAQRTVVCSPDLESRVKGWVDARNLGGLIKVVPQRFCPDDQIWVVDEGALEASVAKGLHAGLKDWRCW